jgi:hypothetical protein
MPLHLSPEPEGASASVWRHLAAVRAGHGGGPVVLRDANAEDLGLLAPHRVYDPSLDALASGAALGRVEAGSWRCLIADRGGALAAAEVELDGAGRVAGVGVVHLNQGPFVAGTAEAVRAAEADPRVAAHGFELRLLRVAAIHLVALWLRAETGAGDDLFVPVAPAPRWLTAGRLEPAAEFLALVAERARLFHARPPLPLG